MSFIAETKGGRLEGRERHGILLFAGVPYAAPPVGERRLRPPAPHPGWEGVRPATAFGPVAVQVGDVLGTIGAAPAPNWSEDCLTVNVQTPALDDGRRPVMVWIHGGAFVNGSGSTPWYDGTRMVHRGDVVVVTVNYRLGALGWLHLGHLDPDFAGSGNLGLLDQVAALAWVRDNIAAFGGDPDNVTVFGESAGAMSVATLLAAPAARGLFAKAVAQSGAAHNVSTPEEAAAVADAVVAELGGGLDDLLAAAPDRILAAQQAVAAAARAGEGPRRPSAASGLPFGPVLDGVVVPEHPHRAVAGGAAADVPLLVGWNRDEWNLFALMTPPVAHEAGLRRRLGRLVDDPGGLLAAYRAALGPAASPQEVFSAVMTDRVFAVPAVRLAEAQAAHQPGHTFVYRFDYPSGAFEGRLGACHALEIPFVFDNLDKPGVAMLTGGAAPQALADAMHGAWLAFARHGTPVLPGGDPWPAYDPAGRATVVFDAAGASVVPDPDGARHRAWAGRL